MIRTQGLELSQLKRLLLYRMQTLVSIWVTNIQPVVCFLEKLCTHLEQLNQFSSGEKELNATQQIWTSKCIKLILILNLINKRLNEA